MKRIYVNTSFQLVNYLWGVLLQNSYWKLSRFFNRWKSFKKRKATRTSVNISQSRMLWLSLFWILEYCLISFCRNHMKRPQPVANMWCEDLVLLRSHQDLANVTHHLVAGRLSLRSVLCEKLQFCFPKGFSDFALCLHRHASFCAGDAEDFSSALHPPELHPLVTL